MLKISCVVLAVVLLCCAPVIADPITGDLNNDGFVGIVDLQIVLAHWDQSVTPGDLSKGDVVPDGSVGLTDLSVILVNWGRGTVPTPGGTMSVGMNLSRVAFDSREWTFVDAMRSARKWASTTQSGIPYDTGQSLETDPNGWPLLQPGQAAYTLLLANNPGAYPVGTYVVTFEGSGSLDFGFDATNVHTFGPNRMTFDVNTATANGVFLRITDSAASPNHVKNIRVWMPSFENAASPFHPLFIQRLQPFHVIRFMDWQRTNGSGVMTWSQRTTPDSCSQDDDRGVALEYMIALCNKLGADAWFCMPHQADDTYVNNFATMVRDNLNPNLKAYVEWSNEVWNPSNPQYQWVTQKTIDNSSIRQINFNNGSYSTGGLTLSVSRNRATYNGQDMLVGANMPRYGMTRSICPRSAPIQRNNMAGNASSTYALVAGGVDNDGVTPLALITETGTRNTLWVRSGTDLNIQNTATPLTKPYDLMGNTIPNRLHYPTSGKIVHGLIFTLCSVKRTDGPNTIETVTLCYSSNDGRNWSTVGVEPGSRWSIDPRYPEPTAGATPTSTTTMGNEWALNWFPIDDRAEPLDIWITFTDYRNNNKDGGTAYICRATRPTVGGTWVVQDARRIYTHAAIGGTEHAHSCAMAKDPITGTWHLIIFYGDTLYNHVVNVTLLGGPDDYLTAPLSVNETWSGGVAGVTTSVRSAQPTACFPLPNGDIAATADNEFQTLCVIKATSLGAPKAEWYNAGPQAKTTTRSTLALDGDFTRDNLGRCYVTRHARREGDTGPDGEESAIASIDGTNWFVIGPKYMRYIAGPYIIGLNNNALYTVPRPTTSTVRTINPLEVAPGYNNVAYTSLMTLQPTDPKNGTVVRRVSPNVNGDYLWPSTGGFTRAGQAMPKPPRPGLVMAFNAANATNMEAWSQQIANNPTSNNTDRTVVAWVLVPQDSANVAFKLWQYTYQYNYNRLVGNAWTKLSIPRRWITGNNSLLQILCDVTTTPTQHPEFAILLEGAYEGRVTPYYVPYGTNGVPNEQADVAGFSVGSDWSIGVDLNYPDYYDSSHGWGPLATFYQDANNYITIETMDSDALPINPGQIPGDLNNDGYVGIADLSIVLTNWNLYVTPGDLLHGDSSGDGLVSLVDLNVVLSHWNQGTPTSQTGGFPYDFKITLTKDGVAGTPVYFKDQNYQMPGNPIRLIVSKVGQDTSVYMQLAGVWPALTTTITNKSIMPSRVKLGSNYDGTAVNALEFSKVAVANTASEVADVLLSNSTDETSPFSPAWFDTWANETARDFSIWSNVFAGQADRLIRVAVGKQDNVWVAENLTAHLAGQYDAISCAAYFDQGTSQFDSNTTVQTIINNAINDTIPGICTAHYQDHAALAQQRSSELSRTIPLLAQEGGQHYTANGNITLPYYPVILDVQGYDDPVQPDMYDACMANLRAFDQAGGSLFMAYDFVGPRGPFGSWGQLQYQNESESLAPKFRALLDYIGR